MAEEPAPRPAARTLHYFYDPLCIWCYAAAPLVDAVRHVVNLPLALHGGGLFGGRHRRRCDEAWLVGMTALEGRVADLTGQRFCDTTQRSALAARAPWLDSGVPIAAVEAAQQLGHDPAAFLAVLQSAWFAEGEAITELPVLQRLAARCDLPAADFAAALVRCQQQVQPHMRTSRRLLRAAGARGYPAFMLESGARWQVLDAGTFLGKPDHWAAYLAGLQH